MTDISDVTSIVSDAQLPAEIDFFRPVSARAMDPRAVLLTGATGLVASYLLDDLLRSTSAIVFCLVRGSNQLQAETRLSSHLKRCGLCQGDFGERIRVIAGDLAEPRFGMSEEAFHELATFVDVIYHSAGWLNMAFPYSRLRQANVTGTLEILRFAGLVQTKPLHYLSSMVIFFSDAHVKDGLLRETDPPLWHDTLKGGYSKSKWVADRLVSQAQQRGLPACIYRPVRIMGHSKTGATNDLNDVLPLLIKGCIALGKFPCFDIQVTMVPVDYVTDAIMYLSRRKSAWGRAYHFFHPAPIAWRDLMGILQDLGYSLEPIPQDEWWRELKRELRNSESDTARRNSLATALLAITAPHFLFYNRPPMDAGQLRDALAGSGISCPPINRSLIETYLTRWQESGFIPVPAAVPELSRSAKC